MSRAPGAVIAESGAGLVASSRKQLLPHLVELFALVFEPCGKRGNARVFRLTAK